MRYGRTSAGFSMIEMLVVVALVAILAAIVLPTSDPTVYGQLRSTAQIMSTDLAYARSLAVANNSHYKISFDWANNRYVMKHSGTNAALTTLPKTPFSSPADTTDQHIVSLRDLPHVGPTVRLAAAASSSGMSAVSDVEFGPLGQTTRTESTVIWLASGSGNNMKYITLEVNPATGLTTVGDFTNDGPPACVIP